MNGPIRIFPQLKPYAWGDSRFIQELLELSGYEGPCAEAWFGAHPNDPALVGDNKTPLNVFLTQNANTYLGSTKDFDRTELTYLLKILAAARPLSIQVHPNKKQAEAGFALEEQAGIGRDESTRSYRDTNHKPELLIALTDFHALCGFKQGDNLKRVFESLPELQELPLEPIPTSPDKMKFFLQSYFALSDAELTPTLHTILDRLEKENARSPFTIDTPMYWALVAHKELSLNGPADRGLLFVYLLEYVHLKPGDALFIPSGVPHAYLRGAAIELMACSDNVLRAGLTHKHVDPEELLRVVCFETEKPTLIEPSLDSDGIEDVYSVPAGEFELRRLRLEQGNSIKRKSYGPQTVLALPKNTNTIVTVSYDNEKLQLRRGQACLLPHNVLYSIQSNDSADIFVAGLPISNKPTPYNNSLPFAVSNTTDCCQFVSAVKQNIAESERLCKQRKAAQVIGTVSGSTSSQIFWKHKLEEARADLGARTALSFHEDLPVNQAFGLLLLWQRLRPQLEFGEGALIAFVFGEGTRSAPFTEAECGQKPALNSFVYSGSRALSIVELALKTFTPIDAFLRRSGFNGIVVKWGDEVQIPTCDLSGSDPRFKDADIVRFISLRSMNADNAANKDWVGVDSHCNITGFIPRRPLAEMERLADKGLLIRKQGHLFGGVNLGSIAVSRALLDLLLEEFRTEVNEPNAIRKNRPDLDPQLFTALTVAAIQDENERLDAWKQAQTESAAIGKLATDLPEILVRLRSVLDRFVEHHGRSARFVALDFQDQYWGDIGQHRQMYEFYMALVRNDKEGEIARALAGIDTKPDERGNRLIGNTRLGSKVSVCNSVLIDTHIDEGEIEGCVLLGTRAGKLYGYNAFDVQSTVVNLKLSSQSGTYKVISKDTVELKEGERATSIFFADGTSVLMRVSEDTDLRDRALTYDVPICGNRLSFSTVHEKIILDDPMKIEAQRLLHQKKMLSILNR